MSVSSRSFIPVLTSCRSVDHHHLYHRCDTSYPRRRSDAAMNTII